MSETTCPNCGYDLTDFLAVAKMATCTACDTSVYLDGAHLTNLGQSGEMHDAPMLLHLGDAVTVAGRRYTVLGHARFDYGPGWWDEYWVQREDGGTAWISVDEGDVILQTPLADRDAPDVSTPPELGDSIAALSNTFRVIEADEATCIAVRGVFPERMEVGARYRYINSQNEEGALLSGEFSTGAPDWYLGEWLDPFELTVSRAE